MGLIDDTTGDYMQKREPVREQYSSGPLTIGFLRSATRR